MAPRVSEGKQESALPEALDSWASAAPPPFSLEYEGDRLAAAGVRKIADAADLYLYASTSASHETDLWLFDRSNGKRRRVATSARDGALAPRGDLVAVNSDGFEVSVESLDGQVIFRASTLGATPVFSPNGASLAYVRVPSNPSLYFGSSRFLQGVVVANLETHVEEVLVAPVSGWHGAIYGVSGWSPDASALFLKAHRESESGNVTTWPMVLDADNDAPSFIQDFADVDPALPPPRPLAGQRYWVPNARAVVFAFNDEIWYYEFHSDRWDELVARRLLGRGDYLQSTSAAGSLTYLGEGRWQVLDLTNL